LLPRPGVDNATLPTVPAFVPGHGRRGRRAARMPQLWLWRPAGESARGTPCIRLCRVGRGSVQLLDGSGRCRMNAQSLQMRFEEDWRRLRRQCLTRRILDGLRATVQLRGMTPETSVEDVRAVMTEESVHYVAPLVEAVEILEAIIFASDGCAGHRQCAHSMEPWQRARKLLEGKWSSEEDGRSWP
jgi:hypothetical protein